jgi:O-antigen ligase
MSKAARAAGRVPAPEPAAHLGVDACALLAVALPTLIAFNVAPSATFFNQAAAFVGWGAFLLVIATWLPRANWPRSRGALALLAAMLVCAAMALAASIFGSVPSTLSLSNFGTILAALLVIAVAASVSRAGQGERAFRALCIALLVAGVASSVIGLLQVFLPKVPDGDWIALASIAGRATGNLRQPNHLSSLLLWSAVAAVWLGAARTVDRRIAIGLLALFVYVTMLTGSRTGALGTLTLAGWGAIDRRLSRPLRIALVLAPALYALTWWGTGILASSNDIAFGAETRFSARENFSSNRVAIWSNTLSLIATHPWLGVGFGDFNFAWTLTPFPGRPSEFFDHTHNLLLNLAVEMGLPLALVVVALLVYALVQALRNAIAAGREDSDRVPIERAAFVIVFLVAVHSMLEYPLWYAYFLLPTAFAFGLCLERPVTLDTAARREGRPPKATRPYVLAAMFMVLGGTLAVYDYMRVVVIFVPPVGAGPLEQRIEDGRRSVLFGHHADYAAATIAAHPGEVMDAFERAPHYLLDTRLMMAWARAFEERGEHEKARWIADRLREFHNGGAEEFFAPCKAARAANAAATASNVASTRAAASAQNAARTPNAAAGRSPATPFQCEHATRAFRFEDFR